MKLATPSRTAAAPKAALTPTQKTAYDELCAPGAQVVSTETCAALKVDADGSGAKW